MGGMMTKDAKCFKIILNDKQNQIFLLQEEMILLNKNIKKNLNTRKKRKKLIIKIKWIFLLSVMLNEINNKRFKNSKINNNGIFRLKKNRNKLKL